MTERSESERAELVALEAELRRATYGKDGPTSPKILGLMVAAADAIHLLDAQDQKPVASDMLPADTIAWSFIDHHQAPVELHEALSDLVRRARNDNAPPDSGAGKSETLCGCIANVYGSLDAEDCARIDREWARMRGYILPTDGTSKIHMPDHGGADAGVKAQIATLAQRFWTIHPRELQDKGMTREEFYIREMTALVAALSPPPAAGWNEATRYLKKIADLVDDENACDPLDDAISYANRALEALRHNAPPDSGAGKSDDSWDEATGYAERLAVALWEKHYKTEASQWKPLSGDLIGILTQIDNMTMGLARMPDHGGADAGVSEYQNAAFQNTDGADPALVLAAVRRCASSWVGEARILGNVRAKDIARAIAALSKPAPAAANASAEARLREALEFYADPFAWKKSHDSNDNVRVPDFYEELSFGDVAKQAIAMKSEGHGQDASVKCAAPGVHPTDTSCKAEPEVAPGPSGAHASDCDKQGETTKSEGGVESKTGGSGRCPLEYASGIASQGEAAEATGKDALADIAQAVKPAQPAARDRRISEQPETAYSADGQIAGVAPGPSDRTADVTPNERFSPRMLILDDLHAVCVGGGWDGWKFYKHPDGQWVSLEKLQEERP